MLKAKSRRRTAFDFFIGSLAALAAALPASAQQTGWSAPADPLGGLPAPLLKGEQLVAMAGGCRMVLPADATSERRKATAKMRWYGACRFGLAHGRGYYDGGASGEPGKFYPAELRMGRPLLKPIKRTPVEEVTSFPSQPGHEESWYFKVHQSPRESEDADRKEGFEPFMGSVFDQNGATSGLIVAYMSHKLGAQDVTDVLWVAKRACPSIVGSGFSIARSLAEHDPPLTAEQQKPLRRYCEAAYRTLKAEPANRGAYFIEFNKVNYGYYFIVYSTRETKTLGADGAAVASTTVPVSTTICPVYTDINSCQPAWRDQLVPFNQPLEAERKLELERRAAADAEVVRKNAETEALAAPLLAAWRAKADAAAARLNGKP